MKKLVPILAVLTLCAPASAHTRTPITSVAEAPRDCPLTVSFGSYAMGIDGRAFERVSALLTRDRGVRAIEQFRWGREGEVTLCARVRTDADVRRLAGRARALVPAKPRGPVTISLGAAPGYRSTHRR